MIYTTENVNSLSLKKYNRFFAFGCSFTNYRWPTWADVIAHEIPDANYVNRALPGAGNQYICTNLSQAIRYFDIGENDLVAIMWSTFYRYDSYKRWAWNVPGNIYTQDMIPLNIVDDYIGDTRGFAMRDLSLIDITTKMLENQPFDSITMWGVHPSKQDYYGLSQVPQAAVHWVDVEVMYKDLDNVIMPDLLQTGCGGSWGSTFRFLHDDGSEFVDYHPKTKTYCDYLTKIGIDISQNTKDWASACDNKTQSIRSADDLAYIHKWYETV